MADLTKIQELHGAGLQQLGFDYQFYYFISLLLDLDFGQKIGYEVKDDVHLDSPNGVTVLYQTKHSISLKANGEPSNLTELDNDLWKTLSNWVDMIKADSNILENHSFKLVTNKSEERNKFILALVKYQEDRKIAEIIDVIGSLLNKTEDENLKKYMNNILSIGTEISKNFFSRLSIVTGTNDIIKDIKNKILRNVRNLDLVDDVYESLSANLHEAKYLEIKKGEKFEISFDDFNSKFGRCFRSAFKDKPLPKRNFPVSLPEKLEDQIFIKQLIDIGELEKDSEQILLYTTEMLQATNQLTYWSENSFILPTEMDAFTTDSMKRWKNEFKSKYRDIEKKIKDGARIGDLEEDVKVLSLQLLDFIRRIDLRMADNELGIELSNGHYYSLSNTPEIGWHFSWENKYRGI